MSQQVPLMTDGSLQPNGNDFTKMYKDTFKT